MREALFSTPITRLFGIRHPILCGGLHWLADARYVAAVVNAGGMGFITCMSFPGDPQAFRREVRRCRELCRGKPFGVSLAISRRAGPERLEPFIDVVVSEGVRFVETAGDSPAAILGRLKGAGCLVMHKAPTLKHAASAEQLDVDAIAVVAGEAGGHPGTVMLPQIIQAPLAADRIRKPLVVAGGMSTGRHLVTAIAMGADGMLMGSRMLVADEIWAHAAYKQHLTTRDENATLVVMKALRNHHRVLANETARVVAGLDEDRVTQFERYAPHAGGELAREAYRSGDFERGLLSVGPSVVFADEVKPVEAIFDQIIEEAAEALRRTARAVVRPAVMEGAEA
ncbi:MAG: nitronate monooxygenase [Rubrivivax sp.]